MILIYDKYILPLLIDMPSKFAQIGLEINPMFIKNNKTKQNILFCEYINKLHLLIKVVCMLGILFFKMSIF